MGPVFYRTESRRHAEQYLRGLLAPIHRKNGWTIAEHVGEPEPKALQRFLNLSPWNVDRLLELNRDYVLENLASPGAILVADPTGFAKKGTKSVGVQRQYSGTLGRIDNCQIATFLAYVTPDRDRVLLDRRLYLPKESWLADRAPLRRGRRSRGHRVQDQATAGQRDDRGREDGGRAVRLVHRRRRIRAEPRTARRTWKPPVSAM